VVQKTCKPALIYPQPPVLRPAPRSRWYQNGINGARGSFLYLVEVAVGGASLPKEPEIFEALRNAREPAQKWMGKFYFDPADISATEPVPDLSEPAIREDRF
jgi:hypothetical protein